MTFFNHPDALLTDDEHQAVRLAGDLWNQLCRAVPDGPTRDADLRELVVHVHAIQHAVMANAAARAFPDTYRLLGGSLRQGGRPATGACPQTTPDPHIDADWPELVLDEKAHRSPFGPGPRRSA